MATNNPEKVILYAIVVPARIDRTSDADAWNVHFYDQQMTWRKAIEYSSKYDAKQMARSHNTGIRERFPNAKRFR